MTGKKGKYEYKEWPSQGLTLENLSDKPMTFRDRKSLEQYCKKTGKLSGALL